MRILHLIRLVILLGSILLLGACSSQAEKVRDLDRDRSASPESNISVNEGSDISRCSFASNCSRS